MPSVRRRGKYRREWTDRHRSHLLAGFAGDGDRFGCLVHKRQRYGPKDPNPLDAEAVQQAWEDLRDELLAEVDDPNKIWAFRRYG